MRRKVLTVYFVVFVLNRLHIVETIDLSGPDVINGYAVDNLKQCGRLCWYRSLCGSYSYRDSVSTAESGQYNCVLHTNQGQAVSGWMRYAASGDNLTNGCRPRSCRQTEVCVPSGSDFNCLYLPCPRPHVNNGDVIFSGTDTGDVATVQCHQGYVVSPRDASTNISCQITSRWTEFEGKCMQAEFSFNPSSDATFKEPMPWPVETDWAMCTRGILTDDADHAWFNLQPVASADVYVPFHVTIRPQDDGTSDIRWNRKVDGVFTAGNLLGVVPLSLGDRFSLTLRVLTGSVDVILHKKTDHTFQVPLGGADGADLSNITYFRAGGSVSFSYVNLISGC
ncbi:hypothetical protein BaRGS_00036106 [Batillaria attramentaria]|uniref:Sushi domain-containing protein n=1 Tax=Batillaria attramentaria TaxID=370345 RepID=A0ABD0JCT6_9CAEN